MKIGSKNFFIFSFVFVQQCFVNFFNFALVQENFPTFIHYYSLQSRELVNFIEAVTTRKVLKKE